MTAALAVHRSAFGPDAPETGDVLNDLGAVAFFQGDFPEARRRFDEALAVRRREGDDAKTGETLSNLAVVIQESGDVEAAEPYLRESRDLILARLGEDHPDALGATSNLAINLKQQGRLAEAEELYRGLVASRRRVLGEAHPLVAADLNNLGRLLQAKRDYAAADSALRAALTLRREVFPGAHRDVAESLHNLANLARARGRTAEAADLYEEALDIRRRVDTRATAVPATLAQLGDVNVELGRTDVAERQLREALALRREVYPEGHWRIAYTEGLLGFCLAKAGRDEEAEPLLRAAARGVDAPEAGESERRVTRTRLAWFLERTGRADEAREVREGIAGEATGEEP
jgi:tetratricopeptide (TPR) repeat protein